MRGLVFCFTLALFTSGCTLTSTERRASAIGLAGAAGGALGKELGHGKPLAMIGGAAAGAGLGTLVLGRDPVVLQDGFDQGYTQGQCDAIKRHYEMRMRQHRSARDAAEESETVWYVVPGPSETSDGRKLEPHKVAIPIKE